MKISAHRIALPLLLLLAVVASGAPAPRKLAGTDEKAVLASFQALMDGLGSRDKAAMMKTLLPGGSATLLRDGKPVQMSFEELTDRLSKPGPQSHEERIHDALIHVDGDLAVLWAPFDFLLDGKVDHCGMDTATLFKVQGEWLIASIADNSHPTCVGKS
jgi:hypothetical protein